MYTNVEIQEGISKIHSVCIKKIIFLEKDFCDIYNTVEKYTFMIIIICGSYVVQLTR